MSFKINENFVMRIKRIMLELLFSFVIFSTLCAVTAIYYATIKLTFPENELFMLILAAISGGLWSVGFSKTYEILQGIKKLDLSKEKIPRSRVLEYLLIIFISVVITFIILTLFP